MNDVRQAARQIELFLEDGERARLIVALAILDRTVSGRPWTESWTEFCEHGCWHGNGCNRCEEERAFWWGVAHPLSKPYPWWGRKRRVQWCDKHGKPWASVHETPPK